MHACSWYWGSKVLGCRRLRLEFQNSAGLRMQPYPRAPDLVWPGHLHGTGCLSARAMDTGFPTVVWRLCLGLGYAVTPPILAWVLGGCAWVRVLACIPPFLAGVFGACVVVCALRLYPAVPDWGVRCGCVCFGLGFGCAPPLLAGVLGCVCVCVRAPFVPCHSWLGCAVWVYVLGLGLRLRPATPGWGVWVCVCLCARSACTPPLLAGVCGVVVCAWDRVSAALRHSWLGCWAVCVCLCASSASALPLLAGVCGVGVCASARVSAALRHSWLVCWGVVLGSCAFRGWVLSCLPALGVFCCGVLLRGGVRCCALCRVRPEVSCCAFPVLSALCGVAVRPCSPLQRCSPVLCPVVLCCLVVLWCPVLSPCLVCFLCLFGIRYLDRSSSLAQVY